MTNSLPENKAGHSWRWLGSPSGVLLLVSTLRDFYEPLLPIVLAPEHPLPKTFPAPGSRPARLAKFFKASTISLPRLLQAQGRTKATHSWVLKVLPTTMLRIHRVVWQPRPSSIGPHLTGSKAKIHEHRWNIQIIRNRQKKKKTMDSMEVRSKHHVIY